MRQSDETTEIEKVIEIYHADAAQKVFGANAGKYYANFDNAQCVSGRSVEAPRVQFCRKMTIEDTNSNYISEISMEAVRGRHATESFAESTRDQYACEISMEARTGQCAEETAMEATPGKYTSQIAMNDTGGQYALSTPNSNEAIRGKYSTEYEINTVERINQRIMNEKSLEENSCSNVDGDTIVNGNVQTTVSKKASAWEITLYGSPTLREINKESDSDKALGESKRKRKKQSTPDLLHGTDLEKYAWKIKGNSNQTYS